MSEVYEGITVVDFSHGMAGGIATMVLSDFGAEVIKVEPPSGDSYRAWPASLQWNRGKKSVCLDLKTAARRTIMHKLTAKADVLVHNLPPALLSGWEQGTRSSGRSTHGLYMYTQEATELRPLTPTGPPCTLFQEPYVVGLWLS